MPKARLWILHNSVALGRWRYCHSWQPRTKEQGDAPICSGKVVWGNYLGLFRGTGGKGSAREKAAVQYLWDVTAVINKPSKSCFSPENICLHGEIKQNWARVSHNLGGGRAQGHRGLEITLSFCLWLISPRGVKHLLANSFPSHFNRQQERGTKPEEFHSIVKFLDLGMSQSPL